MADKHRKYFEDHHEVCLARSRAWKAKNRERHRSYMRNYTRRVNEIPPAAWRKRRLPKVDLEVIRRHLNLKPKVERDFAPVSAMKMIDAWLRQPD